MKEVHLICNAHIDPIWQWDWQEGVSVVLSTFRSAVNLAGEFDYIFCHNEVTVYKYVEEYDQPLFADICRLVKEGKWHIMGGWYLQPDCNMPSGESFVRQILEGKRYFMSRFGVFPTTAINFDPFGHTRGLVQIMKKCGQDSYIHCRPHQGECPLPTNQFLWRGFDGSTPSKPQSEIDRRRKAMVERDRNVLFSVCRRIFDTAEIHPVALLAFDRDVLHALRQLDAPLTEICALRKIPALHLVDIGP